VSLLSAENREHREHCEHRRSSHVLTRKSADPTANNRSENREHATGLFAVFTRHVRGPAAPDSSTPGTLTHPDQRLCRAVRDVRDVRGFELDTPTQKGRRAA
jgi:hypothetical protein